MFPHQLVYGVIAKPDEDEGIKDSHEGYWEKPPPAIILHQQEKLVLPNLY